MMIPCPSYLENHRSVLEIYGYWPGFHDSPVLRFEVGDDWIEMDLEVWETSSELDERGYYKLTKKHRIGFRFTGIVAAELEGFSRPNILFFLGFSSPDDYGVSGDFAVELDSAMSCDLSGSFRARAGEIVFVRPLEG